VSEPRDPSQPAPSEFPPSEPAASEPAPTEPTGPAIPSPDDDRVAVLAAYLRSNQGRFTDEALARKATEAGYSWNEVAAARSLAEGRGWATETSSPSRTNRGVVAAAAIGYVVILYVLISTTGSMSSDLSGTVALVGLLAGVIAWAALRNRRPSLARGVGCGVVLAVVIPVVVIAVIIGICVVSGTFPRGQ
jgi:hypothetical protein